MKALVVIPMPCDARLFFKLADEVARQWESDHPGRTLTMAHMETQASEFGQVTVIWDQEAPAAREQVRPKRRRTLTRELLAEVARTYRTAISEDEPPTAAVAAHFRVSHSTAGRWVVEARKAGTLGPATGTRPGEATPSTVDGSKTPTDSATRELP